MAQRKLIKRSDVVKKTAADVEGIINRLMDEIDKVLPSYRDGGDPVRVSAGDEFSMASEVEKGVIKARIIAHYEAGGWNARFFTGAPHDPEETFLFS